MPPKVLKVNARVVGLVEANRDVRGTITGSQGNGGQKRWLVRWDDGRQRDGFVARALGLVLPEGPNPPIPQGAEGAAGAGAAQAGAENNADADDNDGGDGYA